MTVDEDCYTLTDYSAVCNQFVDCGSSAIDHFPLLGNSSLQANRTQPITCALLGQRQNNCVHVLK